MYKKLADGHASKLLQDCPDLSAITAWLLSDRHTAATAAFRDSVPAKKPGRVLERLARHVRPEFAAIRIAQWDRALKSVFALRIASVPETEIFAMSEEERLAYTERSLVLADLVFRSRGAGSRSLLSLGASVTHHSLSRLLERGASTPETLKADVLEILQTARALRHFLSSGIERGLIAMPQTVTHDLLVPHGEGALVLRTFRISGASMPFLSDPAPVFSVRTYLDGSMLKPRDHERMAGFRLPREAMIPIEDFRQLIAWIRGNAQETDPSRRFKVED